MFHFIINDRPIGQKQVRFPRTKNRRIRRKWGKRRENFQPLFLATPILDKTNNTIICTSAQREMIRRQMTNK